MMKSGARIGAAGDQAGAGAGAEVGLGAGAGPAAEAGALPESLAAVATAAATVISRKKRLESSAWMEAQHKCGSP